ncbi:F-box protein At4g00755-like [Curcuma longa]|uniref:F-box protein At4g00755-like n=1 Tax=Curcuma longa TaxID=136217 RepID=UPI003D9F5772
MNSRWDFLQWLGLDASAAVLIRLDDPEDLARVSAVSRSWRKFVVANGFAKRLCLRISPDVPNFSRIAEVSSVSKTAEVGCSAAAEWESLEREHRVYLYLSHCLGSSKCERNCIYQAINASSTDNYPDESIENTLEPSEMMGRRPSYWSSSGQRDPSMPESLTYKLVAGLCIVDEIKMKPFRAFFQYDHPIYSAKAVRFRMGYSRSELGIRSSTDQQSALVEKYHWTYTSPEFPMVQENVLQSFKLPKPVICLGGILRIELLGRVQKQAIDDLYYICVCYVQVLGRPLSPVLDLNVCESADSLAVTYFPDARNSTLPVTTVEEDAKDSSSWQSLATRFRHLGAIRWNQVILSTLLRPIQFSDDDCDADSDDNDDDYGDLEEEQQDLCRA